MVDALAAGTQDEVALWAQLEDQRVDVGLDELGQARQEAATLRRSETAPTDTRTLSDQARQETTVPRLQQSATMAGIAGSATSVASSGLPGSGARTGSVPLATAEDMDLGGGETTPARPSSAPADVLVWIWRREEHAPPRSHRLEVLTDSYPPALVVPASWDSNRFS